MSSIDLIHEWGADHVVDAMRADEWFALALFSAVADATEIASVASAFGDKAKRAGCAVVEMDDLPARLRRLAGVFEAAT